MPSSAPRRPAHHHPQLKPFTGLCCLWITLSGRTFTVTIEVRGKMRWTQISGAPTLLLHARCNIWQDLLFSAGPCGALRAILVFSALFNKLPFHAQQDSVPPDCEESFADSDTPQHLLEYTAPRCTATRLRISRLSLLASTHTPQYIHFHLYTFWLLTTFLSAFFLLPSAFCLLPRLTILAQQTDSTSFLTSYLLPPPPTAYRLPPTAYRLTNHNSPVQVLRQLLLLISPSRSSLSAPLFPPPHPTDVFPGQ